MGFLSNLRTDQLFCVRGGLIMSMTHNNEYLIWKNEYYWQVTTHSMDEVDGLGDGIAVKANWSLKS